MPSRYVPSQDLPEPHQDRSDLGRMSQQFENLGTAMQRTAAVRTLVRTLAIIGAASILLLIAALVVTAARKTDATLALYYEIQQSRQG